MSNKTPQIEVGEEYTAPSFIEFAAIQIFAALIQIRDTHESFETRATDAWRFAKMLYDAKPKAEPVEGRLACEANLFIHSNAETGKPHSVEVLCWLGPVDVLESLRTDENLETIPIHIPLDEWQITKVFYDIDDDGKPYVKRIGSQAEPVATRTKCWDETKGNKRDDGTQQDNTERGGDCRAFSREGRHYAS